jgi:hypothetical protein
LGAQFVALCCLVWPQHSRENGEGRVPSWVTFVCAACARISASSLCQHRDNPCMEKKATLHRAIRILDLGEWLIAGCGWLFLLLLKEVWIHSTRGGQMQGQPVSLDTAWVTDESHCVSPF